MLDKLLEFGTIFDWISPLVAEIQDHTNGPAHTFLIPEDCGWSGREVEQLLRSYGVKTWGLMIVERMIMITVRQAQARWAQYLLDRERIPIAYGIVDERTRRAARTPKKNGPTNLLDHLDQWLDKLENWLDL